jgi:hypothetical protein
MTGDGTGASTTVEAVPATGVFEPTIFPVETSQAETTVFTVTSSPSTSTAVVTDPPSPAQATSKSNSNNGVSKGAVAGIAIGTCIIGAAIAFIVAFLLFKRRDKRFKQKTCPSGYPIYADSSPELVMVQKSAAAGSPYMQVSQTQMRKPVPVPSRVPVATPQPLNEDILAGIVSPPASEREVQKRIHGLFAQLHRHIDTYYRDVHASITPSMDSDLASFGKDVDLLDLLQSCSRPTVALKHALVAFVLGITGPRSEDDYTLWPTELTHLNSTSTPTQSSPATATATAESLHRRLSVHLYTAHSTTSPPAIREAAEHFSLTFFPWATPSFSDSDREHDLATLIGEALQCRIWLFGQPRGWAFEWEGGSRGGGVVVAPGLVVLDGVGEGVGEGEGREVLARMVVVE